MYFLGLKYMGYYVTSLLFKVLSGILQEPSIKNWWQIHTHPNSFARTVYFGSLKNLNVAQGPEWKLWPFCNRTVLASAPFLEKLLLHSRNQENLLLYSHLC